MKKLLLPFLLLISMNTFAGLSNRAIAITIDDLPFVGDSKNFHLNMIIDTLVNEQIPVTGFVIAENISPDNWDVLRRFHDSGLSLGNHTLTHANLNQISIERYLHEIDAADRILAPVLTKPRFFRYPYLAMSAGEKKDRVLKFLSQKHYSVAPVTIDSKDFTFNQLLLGVPEKSRRAFLEVLKPCYLDFIWQQTLKAEESNAANHKKDQAQILLIHANLLNAYVLPDIIHLFKTKGYSFVRLETALNMDEKPVKKVLVKKERFKKVNRLLENYLAWD